MVLGQGHVEARRQAVTRSQRLVVELQDLFQSTTALPLNMGPEESG